jgi:DNA-directed RNA polymerase subunit beta'
MEDALNTEIGKRQENLNTKISEMEINQATVEDVNQIRADFADEEVKLRDESSSAIEQIKDLHVKELLAENQLKQLTK